MSSSNHSSSPASKRPRGASLAGEDLLTFAIPKKGRLYEQSVDLLKGCGLRYQRNPRLDIAFVNGPLRMKLVFLPAHDIARLDIALVIGPLKMKLVFLPAHDIARFVGEGDVDLGLTGQDMIAESDSVAEELLKTGFGMCQLALQAPKKDMVKDPKQLAGKRIATSFPNLTQKYFQSKIAADPTLKMPSIRTISGSVEAACGLGLADAVVDLVETGATMEEAGLEKIDCVLETQAVLIANPKSRHGDLIEVIRKRIEGYLFAKQFSMIYYNVSRVDLPKAEKITPGRKAPTISPLDNPDWVSVGAMVPSKEVADIMDRLQEIGATDMFIVSIENCRA